MTDVGSWPRSEATLSPCCRALGEGELAEVGGQPASHVSCPEPELPHPGSVPRDTSQHLPSPRMGGLGNDIGDGTCHSQPAGQATTGSVRRAPCADAQVDETDRYGTRPGGRAAAGQAATPVGDGTGDTGQARTGSGDLCGDCRGTSCAGVDPVTLPGWSRGRGRSTNPCPESAQERNLILSSLPGTRGWSPSSRLCFRRHPGAAG